MNNIYCTTNEQEHKWGQHLKAEERGAIQSLKRLGYSNRAIARELNCIPSTIGYELKRGTAEYKGKGRKPQYSAKRENLEYTKETMEQVIDSRPKEVDLRNEFGHW